MMQCQEEGTEIKCRASEYKADNRTEEEESDGMAEKLDRWFLCWPLCSLCYWSAANLLINGRDKCAMAADLSCSSSYRIRLATHSNYSSSSS